MGDKFEAFRAGLTDWIIAHSNDPLDPLYLDGEGVKRLHKFSGYIWKQKCTYEPFSEWVAVNQDKYLNGQYDGLTIYDGDVPYKVTIDGTDVQVMPVTGSQVKL